MNKEMNETTVTAIAQGIAELRSKIDDLTPSLSKKELERVVKQVARFPEQVSASGKKEVEMLEYIYQVKDLQVQLAMFTLVEAQRDKDESSK